MSENPQHNQGDTQEDVEEIISQGPSQPGASAQGKAPVAEAPPAGKAASADSRRSKRSSVYIYLVILFGAAFLMLLLAYFVQQRNNAAVQDDLRLATASRQELMEDLRRLETEKEGLETEKETLQAQVDALQQQLDEQTDQNFWLERELEDQALSWKAIYDLEEDFRTEDYDGCVFFFDNTLQAIHIYTPPEAAPRVEEIYRKLVEKDILNEEDYPLSTILGTPANQ